VDVAIVAVVEVGPLVEVVSVEELVVDEEVGEVLVGNICYTLDDELMASRR
jgi:hypothetical protein